MSGALLLALAGLAGGAAPAPHPNSFSDSQIDVRRGRITVQLRVQVLSVAEVIPGFDDDMDGHTTPEAIEASEAAILDYIKAHYRLAPRAATGPEAADPEAALPLVEGRVFEGPRQLDPMNAVADWIDVVMEFDAGEAGFGSLGVFVDLFEVTSPGHRDTCLVVWNGILHDDRWVFSTGANAHVFEATDAMLERNAPTGSRALRSAIGGLGSSVRTSGLEARPGLLEALLFSLLLAMGARRGAGFLGLGSTVLFWAALVAAATWSIGADVPPSYARFARIAAAAGLIYVGLDVLFQRQGRQRPVEAVAFGGPLGLALMVVLRPEISGEAEGEWREAIAAWTGGAGAALVLATAAAAGLCLWLGRRARAEDGAGDRTVAPGPLRVLVGAAAVGAGGLALVGLLG